ncbi:MAG: HNH endonuclease [Desulfovibrio sp.]|jgi:5-methylcytosine-specific restriction protein A|nr:HNH endonuclease [Desulfovibrio sp.]
MEKVVKPCRKPGCRNLTSERNGYCDAHQALTEERKNRWSGNASRQERGYGKDWQRRRVQTLKADPLCRICKAAGLIRPATIVHHKDENQFNNAPDNLLPLCRDCHERLHGRKK